MSLIIRSLLIFTALFVAVNAAVLNGLFGSDYDEVYKTLFGDEETFLDPLSKESFYLYLHTTSFFVTMLFSIISSIFIRLFDSVTMQKIVVWSIFLSSSSLLIGLFGAFEISKHFIWLYIISFYIWTIVTMSVSLCCIWRTW